MPVMMSVKRAEHWGIRSWAGPTSMIEQSIQSIQTSCSCALPLNLDNEYKSRQGNENPISTVELGVSFLFALFIM
jgi:hypothetical protein